MPRYLRVLAVGGALLAAVIHASGGAAASTWAIPLQGGSTGEAQSEVAPAAPTGATATCTSIIQTTVHVTWSPVTHATTYMIFQSTTSASTGFSSVATGIGGTSWTSPPLSTGNYWFEVAAYEGTSWASPNSAASAQRTITLAACT